MVRKIKTIENLESVWGAPCDCNNATDINPLVSLEIYNNRLCNTN